MASESAVLDSKLGAGPGRIGVMIFGVALLIGCIYAGRSQRQHPSISAARWGAADCA